jgi:hypothetical protein
LFHTYQWGSVLTLALTFHKEHIVQYIEFHARIPELFHTYQWGSVRLDISQEHVVLGITYIKVLQIFSALIDEHLRAVVNLGKTSATYRPASSYVSTEFCNRWNFGLYPVSLSPEACLPPLWEGSQGNGPQRHGSEGLGPQLAANPPGCGSSAIYSSREGLFAPDEPNNLTPTQMHTYPHAQ